MPPHQTTDAAPDPEPDSLRVPFLLLHVPPASDPLRYQPLLVRLAARFRDALIVATVVDGAMVMPPGMCSPAFVLCRAGRVVAQAFGDLPVGELVRLLEHALPAPRLSSPELLTAA